MIAGCTDAVKHRSTKYTSVHDTTFEDISTITVSIPNKACTRLVSLLVVSGNCNVALVLVKVHKL